MIDPRIAKLFVAALLAGLAAGGCTPKDSTSNNPGPSGNGGAPGAGGSASGQGGATGQGGALGDPDAEGPVVDANRLQDMTIREVEPVNLSACEIMRAGPFMPVTGANIFRLDAPAVSPGQQAFRVTLSKVSDSFLTIVVPAGAAGDYVFFTSTLARLALFEVDGAVVPDRNLMGNIMECPEVKARVAFRLMPGTYVLRLGPQTVPLVDLVVGVVTP